MIWGRSKRFVRDRTNGQFDRILYGDETYDKGLIFLSYEVGEGKNMTKSLVHKYARKCRELMNIYSENVDADRRHAVRASYKSHRRASERLKVVFDARGA